MAKFGLFDPAKLEPVEIWDGDYMHFAKPYVTVFIQNSNPAVKDIEIITIRLKAGFSVRKLEPLETSRNES